MSGHMFLSYAEHHLYHFTISEVAADCQELMLLQLIMQPSPASINNYTTTTVTTTVTYATDHSHHRDRSLHTKAKIIYLYHTLTVNNIRIIWRGRQTTSIWEVHFEPHNKSINYWVTKAIKCEWTLQHTKQKPQRHKASMAI